LIVFKRIRAPDAPVLVSLALLVAFSLFFLVEFFRFAPSQVVRGGVSENSYREQVTALLADADPVRGEALLTTYGCVACHREGVEDGVAPSFVGIADRAAERRPPLPASAYLYQSISNPSAYMVEGYANLMPQNFEERMSDEEMGDIIAFLLSQDAH
jgi:cytochrome c551/c552